jgi:LuxR family maltose regulon positive regulatory protein
VSARVRAQRGRAEQAQADRRAALRMLPRLAGFSPWYTAGLGVVLAGTALRLGDVAAARTHVEDALRLAHELPEATALADWIGGVLGDMDTLAESVVLPASLTAPELRVLRLLPTGLSFAEIGSRLRLSANTVRTHAEAAYRKLAACSRAEAVERARAVGLLDGRASRETAPGRPETAARLSPAC